MARYRPTLYQALCAAGCRINHHESDLYVLLDRTAREILAGYNVRYTTFTNWDDRVWADVPFLFDPFWARRNRKEA